MQRSTFKVLFYVKRQSEKHGQVPVMGRITINGTMSQFSSKLSVRSSLWDAKANKASGRSLEAQRLNEKLENIKTNIGKQYQRLCDRDSYVTAEKVRNAFLGMGDDCRLLLQTFDEYLADFRKRVGKDRAYSSYEDYCKRRRRLASFLEYEYRVKDIAFKELKREFIERYVVDLSTVRHMLPGSIHMPIKKLKIVLRGLCCFNKKIRMLFYAMWNYRMEMASIWWNALRSGSDGRSYFIDCLWQHS